MNTLSPTLITPLKPFFSHSAQESKKYTQIIDSKSVAEALNRLLTIPLAPPNFGRFLEEKWQVLNSLSTKNGETAIILR